MKTEVAAEIRAIFNAPDKQTAEALLSAMIAKYEKTAPRLSSWLERNLSQGLTVFALPGAYQLLMRTRNAFTHL